MRKSTRRAGVINRSSKAHPTIPLPGAVVVPTLEPAPGFSLTTAQEKAMGTLVSDASHHALGGGSRCVAGHTVIDGTGKTIRELAALGAPVDVQTTHGVQLAEAPFLKGRAPLYKVVTASGLAVEVTSDHRFWTGDAWVFCRDVKPGAFLAVQLSGRTPQRSSSAHSLSTFRASVQRLKQKASSLLARCLYDPHLYDQLPRLFSTHDQVYHASQYGGQARTLRSPRQKCPVLLSRVLNSRTSLSSTHDGGGTPNDQRLTPRAMRGARSFAYQPYLLLAHVYGQICGWFQGSRQTERQGSRSFDPLQSVGAVEGSFQGQFCPSFEVLDDTPNGSGYRLDKVLSITKTPVQDYYTLHVPRTEQYFANGVLHHNSGKTFLLLRAVIMRALRVPDTRHVVFRFTFSSIKRSVVLDTLPKVMKLCFPGLMEHCKLDKTDYYLTLYNKSEIWFAGLDDKDRTEKILGMEFSTLYFNESSQIPWASIITALTRLAQKNALKLKVYYDFNPPSKKHWTYQVFIEKRDPITKQPLLKDFNYSFYLINPLDNMANLSQEYIDILDSLPEKARNRFLFGRFADDDEGALWTENLLAQNRRLGQQGTLPDFLRVVVAVDPSGCSGPEDTRSDEIGIIVAALGTDSHGYILEDLSGRYSPEGWADIVVEAYGRHKADLIVGEKNYGGDMVRACIHASNDKLPYKDVNATRGKVVRAEPISQIYEQNKVHHVGYFLELEDQMCGMTTAGYMGVKSPDRADACLIAGTMVDTDRGLVPIEKVTAQDKVLTRKGYYSVSWSGRTRQEAKVHSVEFSNGASVTATKEHPFLVGGVWRGVDELMWGDIIHHTGASTKRIALWGQLMLFLTTKIIVGIQKAKIKVSEGTTYARRGEGLKCFIETCGSFGEAPSAQGTTSTTLMGIFLITLSKIWRACLPNNTARDTLPVRRRKIRHTSTKLGLLRPLGIQAKKGLSGIRNTVKKYGRAGVEKSPRCVRIVQKTTCCSENLKKGLAAVLQNVGISTARNIKSIKQIKNAPCVKHFLGLVNIRINKIALVPVYVARVTENKEKQEVYNLHIKGPHEFYANGVLVHNCIWALTELFPSIVNKDSQNIPRHGTVNTIKRGSARYDVGRRTRR